MKIIADNKIPYIQGRLENLGEVIYVSPVEINRELVKDADILLVRTRTRCDEKLLKDSKVRLVATATVGIDHIDSGWCEANGIKVRNAAGCNAPGVAQYVWSSLIRKGFDPKAHTLGIVGYGNIGRIVYDWGKKMGFNVIVCDPPREEAGCSDIDYISLEELLKNSNAVTLHVPLTRDGKHPTLGMIGDKELRAMKDGAILINASRGGTVDEEQLKKHLHTKRIKAVVDVWKGEPKIDKELLDLAETATTHIAGYSLEGKQRATRMTLEAIEETFGVTLDKSGLAGTYVAPSNSLDPEIITDSFNPKENMKELRENPSDFENIRETYVYRNEPKLK